MDIIHIPGSASNLPFLFPAVQAQFAMRSAWCALAALLLPGRGDVVFLERLQHRPFWDDLPPAVRMASSNRNSDRKTAQKLLPFGNADAG